MASFVYFPNPVKTVCLPFPNGERRPGTWLDAASLLKKTYAISLFSLLMVLALLPQRLSAQCGLACNQAVQLSLDSLGTAVVLPEIIAPYAVQTCQGGLELTVYDPQNNPISSTLTCSRLNQTLTVKVRHISTGNICWGSVVVKDYYSPVLKCTEKFIPCTADTAAASVGFPAVSDNCTPLTAANLIWSNQKTDLDCFTSTNGVKVTARIDRTYRVTDSQGNTSTCKQKIWIKRNTLNDVVFPPNRDGVSNPALPCGSNPNDLNLAGQPTVEGRPIYASGDCELVVSFSDQIANICPPASYRVLRNWTVTDLCSGAFSIHVQVVGVEDKLPPVITAPANITVGTAATTCNAAVSLPQASATDNCSTFTITPSWSFGNGYGPFNNVPTGSHTVTYTATDACGNSASKTMTVTVVDNVAPTMICKPAVLLSLSSTGTANVTPTNINDGVSDNCGAMQMDVSRDGSNYAPQVVLTCADIAVPVPVTLRATDALGNSNTCNTLVTVRDNLKPTIQCPANQSLTCQAGSTAPTVTGSPLTSDNCSTLTVEYTDVSALNGCNIGSITRTWKATDGQGNKATCSHVITLSVVNTTAVQFPADKTINNCASAADYAVAITGSPVVSGAACLSPSVTHTDEILAAPPACFNVLRRWKVIDWCIYDPNAANPIGIWEQTQVIKVYDNMPPALSVPADLTIAPNAPNCQASISMASIQAVDCSATVTVSHNSPYAAQQGANASGTYPLGAHIVVFTAQDDCGNQSTASVKITVKDATAPTAVCANNVVIQILPSGTGPVNVVQIDAGSSDICTDINSLNFTVNPVAFICTDLGAHLVTLTVTDASGNTATCQTTVNVSDSQYNACNPIPEFDLSGTIRTEGNVPVASIPVELVGEGFYENVDCSQDGVFYFPDVSSGNVYHLKPYNNRKWLNGLSTYDLLLISKHLLGIQPLNTPYKIIAADANRSGTVTTYDIVQLRKVILGIFDTVPGSSSWRFVRADHIFPALDNPFAAPIPEEYLYTELTADMPAQDFIAMKIGDVNNSTNPAAARSPEDTVRIWIDNRDIVAGEIVEVPVKIEKWTSLEGFQFDLWLDTTKVWLKNIELPANGAVNTEHVGSKTMPNGCLPISWDNPQAIPVPQDSVMMTLVLEAKTNVSLQDLLAIHPERLTPEAYVGEEGTLATLEMAFTGARKFHGNAAVAAAPNPFDTETTLTFEIPAAAEVTLMVMDAVGKIVLEKTQPCYKGQNAVKIRRAELPVNGVYCYTLQSNVTVKCAGKVVLMGN